MAGSPLPPPPRSMVASCPSSAAADRTGLLPARRGVWRAIASEFVCARAAAGQGDAEQHGAGQDPAGKGSGQRYQAYPAIESEIARQRDPTPRPRPLAIAASRGSVTSFPGHRCGKPPPPYACGKPAQRWQVMATYSPQPPPDAFLAAGGMNRAGDFVGIDPAVGAGLGKIPRLAVGAGGVGAAFVAPGEAMVDAIAVGLVGDDEDAAVGQRRPIAESRNAEAKRADGNRMVAPRQG